MLDADEPCGRDGDAAGMDAEGIGQAPLTVGAGDRA